MKYFLMAFIILFAGISISSAQLIVKKSTDEIMRCTSEKTVGINASDPKATLQINQLNLVKNGLWPTQVGSPRNGVASIFLPIENYDSNELTFGLSGSIPMISSDTQSGRSVSAIVYQESSGQQTGIVSGVLGKTDGQNSIYGLGGDLGTHSIIGVSGQVYNTVTDNIFTAAGYFSSGKQIVSGNENHYGIYVDAEKNNISGNLTVTDTATLGTGTQLRNLYACGSPIQGMVVIGADVATAVANCQRVNSSVSNVNLLPITVNIN
ncbi:hypothetical protein GF407_13775 [candidate division KSB1 bacterium]|nr:hypothetical protein [candidate division KSB1 bacterium]